MRVSFLQSHIGNGVSFLNKTLSAKLFSPNANAEGRCALLVAGGLWPGPAPRLRTMARDAAPAMLSVPAAKHRRAAGQRRHSAVLWRSAKRQPPALTCRPRSQLMLDFLREFRHGGEKLLLRWGRGHRGACARPAALTSLRETMGRYSCARLVPPRPAWVRSAHRLRRSSRPACLPACLSQPAREQRAAPTALAAARRPPAGEARGRGGARGRGSERRCPCTGGLAFAVVDRMLPAPSPPCPRDLPAPAVLRMPRGPRVPQPCRLRPCPQRWSPASCPAGAHQRGAGH